MPSSAAQPRPIHVETLDAARFEPYGWKLGKPVRANGDAPAFLSPASDFWHEHLFDAGAGGQPEILWVSYRNREMRIASLELHRVTQQAIVPLTAPVVHVVARSDASGAPDPATLRAFEIPVGEGVCMAPGTWHATRVHDREASCLMLTRASTTLDLIAHLSAGQPAAESEIRAIEPLLVTL
ncbi:ureidoglycolate lyase [Burkholderia gladioli]|uniref:ureidoglycolate lyase n=1 Tax=Burkholderia gladioli TaxID=28095 RepID=UPI00163FE90A|nr:ureidoglycolate lyase [Burkholderia gladioli]